MVKNPYTTKSVEELYEIYNDILASQEEGARAESLVPYARMLRKNLGEDDISLRETLEMAKKDFFEEIAKRFFGDWTGLRNILDAKPEEEFFKDTAESLFAAEQETGGAEGKEEGLEETKQPVLKQVNVNAINVRRAVVERMISELAEDVHKAFSIPVPVVDMDEAVRKIGGVVVEADRVDSAGSELCKTGEDSFEIRIPKKLSVTDRRWRIAQELGSLFLRMGYRTCPKLWEEYEVGDKCIFSHAIHVWRNNVFAGMFLMPETEFRTSGKMMTHAIADHFGVDLCHVLTRQGQLECGD